MLNRSRTLAGALVLIFVACSTLVGCGSAVRPEPTDVVKPSSSGLCGDPWSSTNGPMAEARQVATATRLGDGTVVVAGGYGVDGSPGAGAQRYDPNTGTWSVAGDLQVPRAYHRAVWLNDGTAKGKVLVVGGITDSGPTGTAEIYNPATNTWSLVGSMSIDRMFPQVTVLSNGPNAKVLVSGGISAAFGRLSTAEIYDPQANTWSPAGTMATARIGAGSALLPNGKVLVAGGSNGESLSSAEIFNPPSGTWSAAPSMSVPRYGFGMAALRDGPKKGQVLAAGGTEESQGAEIFDPTSGTWSPTTDMAQPGRYYFEAIALADGRMMVAGGSTINTPVLDSVEIFDASPGHGWTQVNSLNLARYNAASAELLDGSILVAGGYAYDVTTGAEGVTNAAETYLPCPANLAPVAVCRAGPIVLNADATCKAAVMNVDNGSYDPDNQPLPLATSQVPTAGTLLGLGSKTVDLFAWDGELQGTCSTTLKVEDHTPPTITCPDNDPNLPGNQVYLECVNGGATGTFTAQVTDNCGVSTSTCTPSSATLPLGSTPNVTCTAKDGSQNQASCNLQAIVRDTRPPVTGTSKGMVLGPADGTFQEISLMDCANFTIDACGGRLNPLKNYAVITHITSDEPENAPGGSDDNTIGDMQVKKPWLALLRAERDSNGNGRVYTIHYLVKDPSGNSAMGACMVGVPRTPGSPAVDSGPAYCLDDPFTSGNACP